MRRWVKGIGIGLIAVVLSTLGISASDTLRGVSGSLVGLALKGNEIVGCATGSAHVVAGGRDICVDLYEASPDALCPNQDPKNLQETERNLAVGSCAPISKSGTLPWRFVNLSQAQRACAAAGKRLLSNEEWYRAALGTPADEKVCGPQGGRSDSAQTAGESPECVSTTGAYDMIGNVWEWVDGQVESGSYRDRVLPNAGYVTGVDQDGVALSTGEGADELYGKDYMWQDPSGIRGMLRGGFYGNGEDAGLYALNASVDLGFGSAGIGFRCVSEYPN